MAFRIEMEGAVVEVETAAEAVTLLRAARPLPPLMPSPAPVEVRTPPAPPSVHAPTLHLSPDELVGIGTVRFRRVHRAGTVRIIGPCCARCGRLLDSTPMQRHRCGAA